MGLFSHLQEKVESAFNFLAYSRVRAALKWVAAFLVLAVGLSVMHLIDHEYQNRLVMVFREEHNLLLALEENVRRDLDGADEILRELKRDYEAGVRSSPELLEHIRKSRAHPLVHVSLANDQGIIVASTLPELVAMDISDGEYFQHFRKLDDPFPFYAKPVIGRKTQKWLFHISRRLNRADGSFGGTVTAGIEPSHFGEFYQKMQLGKGFSVSIIGLDGVIRVRQTADKMDAGIDVREARLFELLKEKGTGSYIGVSAVDKRSRVTSYRKMKDHPIVLVISVLESEAFADYSRLRDRYWLMALMGSLLLAGFFALLIRALGQRENMEILLRQMNEQLAGNVAQRTEELEAANKELQIMAMLDGLTGIANRRNFDDQYDRRWRTALRQGTPLSLVMADIDWFKAYNDAYGHQTGDECLKQVAQKMRDTTKRGADFAARYGGEEFIVILPDTRIEGAVKFAERVRARVEALDIEHNRSPLGHVTISLGVASAIPREGREPLELIDAADKALYEAKHAGRNCVRQAREIPE